MSRMVVFAFVLIALIGCSGAPSAATPPAGTLVGGVATVPRKATPLETLQAAPPVMTIERPPITTPLARSTLDSNKVGPTVIVLEAMRRINRLKGYRALQTIISNQSTITRTIEALPPDRLHMVTHGQGFVNESIVISNTVYARQATGPWQKFQAESAASAAAPLANGENNAVLSSETQFGQAEEKTIDGVLMRAYRSEAGSAQAGGANIQTVWVGVQDGLVHRAETLLSVQSAGQKITTQSTIVYYDLDAPDIVIEPPIP